MQPIKLKSNPPKGQNGFIARQSCLIRRSFTKILILWLSHLISYHVYQPFQLLNEWNLCEQALAMLVWQAWHFVLHLLQRLQCLGVERRKHPKGLKGWERGKVWKESRCFGKDEKDKQETTFNEFCKKFSECLVVLQSCW